MGPATLGAPRQHRIGCGVDQGACPDTPFERPNNESLTINSRYLLFSISCMHNRINHFWLWRRKETAGMSVFWAVILERINAVSKSLQKETTKLKGAVNLLKSLSDFVTSLFDEYKEKAILSRL